MSVMMPRGVHRVCDRGCGYAPFTMHTEQIPCATLGCDGQLGWPDKWPHVCTASHAMEIPVRSEAPFVPTTACDACEANKTRRSR